MIEINKHPVWRGVNPLKKPAHLLRLKLARQYSKMISQAKFIGVTGSVGKTTTVSACKEVLSQQFKTISSLDAAKDTPNLDMVFSLPITILRTRPSIEKVVLEMGIEYQGEMEFFLTLVHPQTAVVTRVANAHSEYLGGIENIAREKGRLVEQLPEGGAAILNYDDPLVRKMADHTRANVYFYGTDPEHCNVWASDIRIKDFELIFGLNFGVERIEVRSKLLGTHFVYPLLAAATLGVSCNMSLTKIKRGLEEVKPAPHRMQALDGFNDSVILDDTYNAAPVAVEQALETLSRVPAHRRIVVLGEMKELGPFSEELHRRLAQKIFQERPDLVFLGSGDTKYIADELLKLGFLSERLESNVKNPEIVSKLLKILSKGDVVLVKGAHSVRLDEVVSRLVKLKK